MDPEVLGTFWFHLWLDTQCDRHKKQIMCKALLRACYVAESLGQTRAE